MASFSRALVTGSSGYIGERLVRFLTAQGVTVVTLARKPSAQRGVIHIPWCMGDPVPADAMAGVQAVFHLAHQWSSTGPLDGDVNVRAGKALLEAARAAGVDRFIMGSTVSARHDALNRYGRLKAAMEALLDRPGELAARIGLVYGGPAKSQWGVLLRLTALPALPMLDPGKAVQPIHLDDLCQALIAMAGLDQPQQRIYPLADPNPLAFGDFLRATANSKHGHALPILPIPSRIALWLVDLAAHIPGLPRVDRERILGMMGLPVLESDAALAELKLNPRPLEQGLALEPAEARRRLLREARTILVAVGGKPVPPGLMIRYVRGVCQFEGGTPIPLPPSPLIPACEAIGAPQAPLNRRLALAARVIEASPLVSRFAPRGRMATLGRLVRVGLREACLLPIRLLAGHRR